MLLLLAALSPLAPRAIGDTVPDPTVMVPPPEVRITSKMPARAAENEEDQPKFYEYNTMVFDLVDNTSMRVYMRVDTRGVVSEDLSNFVFTGPTQSVSVPVARISKIHYEADPASVNTIVQTPENYTLSREMVSFSNLPDGSLASVYDISGKLILSESVKGEWSLSLGNFPAGTYVIRVNETSVKIVK